MTSLAVFISSVLSLAKIVICLPWVSRDPSVIFPPRTICFPQGIQRSLLSWQHCILYSYRIVVSLLVSYSNETTISVQYSSRKPFLLNFLQISYILSSYLCSHSNVPLSFPNVEPRVFWSTGTTVIPKSTLGKGKRTQVFTSIAALPLLDPRYSFFFWIQLFTR